MTKIIKKLTGLWSMLRKALDSKCTKVVEQIDNFRVIEKEVKIGRMVGHTYLLQFQEDITQMNGIWTTLRVLQDNDEDYARNCALEILDYLTKDI